MLDESMLVPIEQPKDVTTTLTMDEYDLILNVRKIPYGEVKAIIKDRKIVMLKVQEEVKLTR